MRALKGVDFAEALDAQGRLLGSILEDLPDAIIVADAQGKVVYVNRAGERIQGECPRELSLSEWMAQCGFYLPDAVTRCPPEQLPLARAILGVEVVETEIFVKNERLRAGAWISANAAPLRDRTGRVWGGVMVLHDITSSTRNRGILHRIAGALDQTADSVVITDTSGLIEYVNWGFENITGYTGEEVLGKDPRALRSKNHSDEFYGNLRATLLAGRVFRGTIAIRKKNGELYYSEQTITPLKGARGHIEHFVSVGQDVTGVLRAAEEEDKMQLARIVQQKLYPADAPSLRHFDIAGAAHPVDATGGDCFDYISVPDGRLDIAIGDVSGHGIATALIMAGTRGYLRAMAKTLPDVREVLAAVNSTLVEDVAGSHYVTMVLAQLDPRTRSFVYSSAGHIPGYVLDRRGAVRKELSSTGLPLGLFREWECSPSVQIPLEAGELVVFWTDGVTEAEDQDGRVFGPERALDFISSHRHETSRDIVHNLFRELQGFAARTPLNDDMTAVIFKVVS